MSSPTAQLQNNNFGLTLVELLLATGLFTVVLAAAGSLLVLGMQASRLPARAEPLAFERAMLQLERDLDAARPLPAVPVVIAPDRFEFAAVDGAAGWRRLRYSITTEGDAHALLREQFDVRDDRVIARDTLLPVEEAAFSFAVVDESQALAWRDTEWPAELDGVPQLPRLIRLRGRLSGASSIAVERVLRRPDGALPVVQP